MCITISLYNHVILETLKYKIGLHYVGLLEPQDPNYFSFLSLVHSQPQSLFWIPSIADHFFSVQYSSTLKMEAEASSTLFVPTVNAYTEWSTLFVPTVNAYTEWPTLFVPTVSAYTEWSTLFVPTVNAYTEWSTLFVPTVTAYTEWAANYIDFHLYIPKTMM
jgi:hypothetical protein